MTFLYFISIHLYYLILLVISPFNIKARLWLKGRLGWRTHLKEWRRPGDRVIWFHAASLGEFEQGRPVIDQVKGNYPGYRVVLTFYSPSGFEIRKNYPGADLVMYLPLDTPYNARKFLKLINPDAAVFIKYEFWRFYLQGLWAKQKKVYLISANFRPRQVFFRWYGGWFRNNLSYISHFFVQDETSASLLNDLGISRVFVSGDTRFDRVAAIAEDAKGVELAENFSEGHFCLVAGSTWPGDEDILVRYINQSETDLRFIIAPHEITESHLNHLKSGITRRLTLFSSASPDTIQEQQVLLIDNIGMLSSLYRYGRIAYIGGGFGKGIHNILEAATYGIPVIFGTNYNKFREARELISLGGAFSVQSPEDFLRIFETLRINPGQYERAAMITRNYVKGNTGATSMIMSHLMKELSPAPPDR